MALGHLPASKTTEILSGKEGREEFRKASLLLDFLSGEKIEKVDVIAHSEGAINTLIAALIKPEQFRNIVLDMPAGLIGKDRKYFLIGRFCKLFVGEAFARPSQLDDPTNALSTLLRVDKYVFQNDGRTNREVEAIARADISEMIKKLSEQGVKISVIAGVNDPLFPVNRQIASMRRSGGKLPLRGYYSVIGGHNELSINPGQHAALAFNALENLRDLST